MPNDQQLLERITSDAENAHEVLDPATGERIGRVAFSTSSEVAEAVARAAAAQPAWAATPDE